MKLFRWILQLTIAVLICADALSCVLTRSQTIVRPESGVSFSVGAQFAVANVEVERRTQSTEIRNDIVTLLPVILQSRNSAPPVDSKNPELWQVKVKLVEREIMRDFNTLYATMVNLEFSKATEPAATVVSVIYTVESVESVASPLVLKWILNECVRAAGRL